MHMYFISIHILYIFIHFIKEHLWSNIIIYNKISYIQYMYITCRRFYLQHEYPETNFLLKMLRKQHIFQCPSTLALQTYIKITVNHWRVATARCWSVQRKGKCTVNAEKIFWLFIFPMLHEFLTPIAHFCQIEITFGIWRLPPATMKPFCWNQQFRGRCFRVDHLAPRQHYPMWCDAPRIALSADPQLCGKVAETAARLHPQRPPEVHHPVPVRRVLMSVLR